MLLSSGFGGTKNVFSKLNGDVKEGQINVYDMKNDHLLASLKLNGAVYRMSVSSRMDKLLVKTKLGDNFLYYVYGLKAPSRDHYNLVNSVN